MKKLDFFSSDKNPSNAKGSQNITKMVLLFGFVILVVIIIATKGDGGAQKRQIGDFQLVNEEEAVKTRFMGDVKKDMSKSLMNASEQRAEYTQFKRDKKALYEKQEAQSQKIDKMYAMIMGKEDNTFVSKNPSDNYMAGTQKYPLSPGQNSNSGRPQLMDDFAHQNGALPKGSIPPVNRKTKVVYQAMTNEMFFGSDIDASVEDLNEKKNDEIKPLNLLPTGSILPVVLLSGFDAPTLSKAKNSPVPLLMKVTEPGKLPNNFSYDMKECFILGEGYGDLSSERAYVRTTRMSCITYDGLHIEIELAGFVAGIDNKNGIRGRVVSKQNDLLTRTALAGFLEGMSKGFNLQNQTVTQSALGTTTGPSSLATTDVMKMGVFGGASEAAERLSDFYMDLADELTPVIEVPAGLEVDVIVLDKHMIKTLEESKKLEDDKTKKKV